MKTAEMGGHLRWVLGHEWEDIVTTRKPQGWPVNAEVLDFSN